TRALAVRRPIWTHAAPPHRAPTSHIPMTAAATRCRIPLTDHQVQNRLADPAERRRGQSTREPTADRMAGSRVSATSVAVDGMNSPEIPNPRTTEFGTTISANSPSDATTPLN